MKSTCPARAARLGTKHTFSAHVPLSDELFVSLKKWRKSFKFF